MQNPDFFSIRKAKTPLAKQFKRDIESKKKWKSKAVQRSLEINVKKKTIEETRESREFHKTQNKKILIESEKLSLELEQLQQKYVDELLRSDIEKERRLLAEGEIRNVTTKLEKVLENLKEANKRIEVISFIQIALQSKLKNLNTAIESYSAEKLRDPESEFTIEMSRDIQMNLIKLEEEFSESEKMLQFEEHQKQVNQSEILFKNPIYENLSDLYRACQAEKGLKQLKKVQKDLTNGLKACFDRFKNKKNRQGSFNTHERPNNHSFSVSIIKWALILLIGAGLSIRAVAKTMAINALFSDIPTPSHTIIGEWAKKTGFYIYHLPKDKEVERVWIIDFSIEFGQDKLMLVLGIDAEKIKFWKKSIKNNKKKKKVFKVSFKDVEILHMAVIKSTAYENTLQELKKIGEKCGLPSFVLSDEGSDLSKAIRIFVEDNPGIEHLNDISHKFSNILKAELENKPKWIEFCKIITQTKQKLKLSNIAEMCPPKLRQKVRFLNVHHPLGWAVNMLNMDVETLNVEQRPNFIRYIKEPLEVLRKEIIQWHQYSNFIRLAETEIKHNGLTRGYEVGVQSTSEILSNHLKDQKKSKKIYNQILKFVKQQEKKLSLGQTVISSSDIIESLFGKWKSMVHEDSMAGITDMILILPLLTVKITNELVLAALEDTPIQKINDWNEQILGATMFAKRHAILHPKNKLEEDKKSGDSSLRNLKKVA